MTDIYIEGFSFALGALAPGRLEAYFEPRRLRRMEGLSKSALWCACEALTQAGLEASCPKEMGLSLAVGAGSLESTCKFMDSIIDDGDELSSPTAFAGSVHNSAALSLSLFLGLRGPCVTAGQFDASFAAALLNAQLWLQQGFCSRMLVVAAEDVNPVAADVLPQYPKTFAPLVRGLSAAVPFERAAAAFVLCAEPSARARAVLKRLEFARTGEESAPVAADFISAAQNAVAFARGLKKQQSVVFSDVFAGVRTQFVTEAYHAQ